MDRGAWRAIVQRITRVRCHRMTKHVHAHPYIHTQRGILFIHEKGGYPVTWISLEHINLSEISQKEKVLGDITYMWNQNQSNS